MEPANGNGFAQRQVIWRVLPSLGSLRAQKDTAGYARLFIDSENALNLQSDDLGLALRIHGPSQDSGFEFTEPPTNGKADFRRHPVARLTHGGPFFSPSKRRTWEFYAAMEMCECKLFTQAKGGKQINAMVSSRTVGFCASELGRGRKIVVFKERGRRSPIFEIELAESEFVVARGPGAFSHPEVSEVLDNLKKSDAEAAQIGVSTKAAPTMNPVFDDLEMEEVDEAKQ